MATWKAVAVNDTAAFNLDPEDAPHIYRIWSVYFYDADERTHLCEATPSYHLRGLYTTVEFFVGVCEEVRERIYDRYTQEGVEDTYMHCSTVERFHNVEYGPVDDDTTEDDVREHWQGNHPF